MKARALDRRVVCLSAGQYIMFSNSNLVSLSLLDLGFNIGTIYMLAV